MLSFTEDQCEDFKQHQLAYIEVEEAKHVLTVTLNRPEKKNAMTPLFMAELVFALNYAHYSKNIWVVIIQAKGDVFCAGADLNIFAGDQESSTESTLPIPQNEILLGETFESLLKPCIAKVQGSVYAGGFLIICGCTHVISAHHAQFSLPEVKRGLFPMQVMAGLLKIMPQRKALDLCMSGRTFNSIEALEMGIVTQIVDSFELDEAVRNFVSEIKKNSPTGIRYGLMAFKTLKEIPGESHHQFLYDMLQEVLRTEDAKEGIAAFKEKRKPKWTGQ